jgi:hypothetical protein
VAWRERRRPLSRPAACYGPLTPQRQVADGASDDRHRSLAAGSALTAPESSQPACPETRCAGKTPTHPLTPGGGEPGGTAAAHAERSLLLARGRGRPALGDASASFGWACSGTTRHPRATREPSIWRPTRVSATAAVGPTERPGDAAGEAALGSAELFGERDDDAIGAADVAEPIGDPRIALPHRRARRRELACGQ